MGIIPSTSLHLRPFLGHTLKKGRIVSIKVSKRTHGKPPWEGISHLLWSLKKVMCLQHPAFLTTFKLQGVTFFCKVLDQHWIKFRFLDPDCNFIWFLSQRFGFWISIRFLNQFLIFESRFDFWIKFWFLYQNWFFLFWS